jgi:hypothetical protein
VYGKRVGGGRERASWCERVSACGVTGVPAGPSEQLSLR